MTRRCEDGQLCKRWLVAGKLVCRHGLTEAMGDSGTGVPSECPIDLMNAKEQERWAVFFKWRKSPTYAEWMRTTFGLILGNET